MKRLLQPFAVTVTAAGLVLGSPVGLAFADPSDPGTPEPPPVVETIPAPQVPQLPDVPPVVAPPAPPPVINDVPPAPAPAPVIIPERPAPVPVPAPAPEPPAPKPAPPAPAPEPLPTPRQPEVKPAPAPQVPEEKPAPVQDTPDPKPETPATTPRQVPQAPREQVSPPAETAPGGEVETEDGSSEQPATGGDEPRSNLPTTPGGREQAPAVPGGDPSGETTEPSGSNPSGGQVENPQGEVPGSAGVVEDPNEGAPVTEPPEVKIIEAPVPEAPLPVTEEMLAQPSIEATVQDLSTVDASSDRGPRPGGPVELPKDDGNPPPTTNVNVIGDNNNVTIINVVDSKDVNINVDQGNDEHFVVMRRLDKPGHEFRFPSPPNRPIRLPHNFCGGEAGVWAVAGAGIGPNGPWANASAGVFATSGRCGVVGYPPRPHYRPAQLTICPPVGWRGQPMFVGNYTYINETTIFANNTYMQGTWVNQTINGVPQQQFQVTGHSANPVFQQQPAAGPPSWSWPDGGLDPQAAAPSVDQVAPALKWGAGIAVVASVWLIVRRLRPRKVAGQ